MDPDPALDPEHCFNLIRQYKLKNRTLCLPGVYSCCSIEPAVGVSATDHIRLQDVQQGRAVGEQQHLHTMQIIIFIKSRYCYRKSSQDGKLFSENQQSEKKKCKFKHLLGGYRNNFFYNATRKFTNMYLACSASEMIWTERKTIIVLLYVKASSRPWY